MSTQTKLITSFDEAIEKLGLPTSTLPDVSKCPTDQQASITAHAKLLIIVTALNDGWKPDWNNDDEYKYYPWWNMEKTEDNPSGFGLLSVNSYSTYSTVGSRLCFKSRALAKHAAEHFIDLYREMLTY